MSLSIGVIIPTLNQRPSVHECLARLARQTLCPQRVYLVLDEGAAAFSPNRKNLGSLPLTILRNSGRGPCEGRNTALAVCREDVAAFLDDDSLPGETWVAECVRGFEESAYPARLGRICWSRSEERVSLWQRSVPRLRQKIYDARHGLYGSRELRDRVAAIRPLDGGRDSDGLALHLSGGNSAVRMDLLTRVGFYDTRFSTYHDRELAYRLLARGDLIAYCSRMTVWHDHNPSVAVWVKRALFASQFDSLIAATYPPGRWRYPALLDVLRDRQLVDDRLHFSPGERLFLAVQRWLVRWANRTHFQLSSNPLSASS